VSGRRENSDRHGLHDTPPEFRPSKRLGQNFLHNPRVIDQIVDALAPRSDETIVEIGPGTGALTERLLERSGRVVAVEFDRALAPRLLERFRDCDNFSLLQADALETDYCALIAPSVQARLAANLPYNISTAIVQHLIDQRHCLTEMILMLQREVAERITAPPSSSDRGFLSVIVQAYFQTERLFDVAPGSFRPAPKVWSSVVRLNARPGVDLPQVDAELFRRVISAGFAQPRKTILNNLRQAVEPLQQLIKDHGGASIVLCEAQVALQRRAETLTVDEWTTICRQLS
jgi:16S rRNA (adenine1518-N6/adenine1519-N6)-dimethyltransferase